MANFERATDWIEEVPVGGGLSNRNKGMGRQDLPCLCYSPRFARSEPLDVENRILQPLGEILLADLLQVQQRENLQFNPRLY
jgi:hypothetical protein